MEIGKIILIVVGVYLLIGLLGVIFAGEPAITILTWPIEFMKGFAEGVATP